MNETEDQFWENLEGFAMQLVLRLQLHPPLTLSDRVKVAFCCGYMDAKHMVFMKETYGFPLEAYMDQARKTLGSALKLDYAGLRHELLMAGTRESAVEAEFAELKWADREWKLVAR
jgi:hypothetical protein